MGFQQFKILKFLREFLFEHFTNKNINYFSINILNLLWILLEVMTSPIAAVKIFAAAKLILCYLVKG